MLQNHAGELMSLNLFCRSFCSVDCTLGCTEYQKIFKFWCLQAFLGQKICPEKKLENGFFPKIDVAIVGWTSFDIAISQQKDSFFLKI